MLDTYNRVFRKTTCFEFRLRLCDWVSGTREKNLSVIDCVTIHCQAFEKMAFLHSEHEAKLCKICKMAVSP